MSTRKHHSTNITKRRLYARLLPALAVVFFGCLTILPEAKGQGFFPRPGDPNDDFFKPVVKPLKPKDGFFPPVVKPSHHSSRVDKELRLAIDEGHDAHEKLHHLLEKPGNIQRLVAQPLVWQASLKDIQAALKRAQSLAAVSRGSLDGNLLKQLQELQHDAQEDARDMHLALRLEQIRMEKASYVAGNSSTAPQKYDAVFRKAGLPIMRGYERAVAARIRTSHVAPQLICALDDWALAERSPKQQLLLLTVCRLADPDPWRDQLRSQAVWKNRPAFEKLVKQADPSRLSPQTVYMTGVLLLRCGGDAETWLRGATIHHPADYWLHVLLGTVSTTPGEAAGCFRAALALRPNSISALNNLGVALMRQHDAANALVAYRKALVLDGNSYVTWLNMGQAYHRLGDLDRATSVLRKATTLNPNDAAAHYYYAEALWDKQFVDAALAAYRKAVQIDPGYANAHIGLGQAYRSKGQLRDAITSYRTAVNLAPNNENGHFRLGLAYYADNNFKPAQDCFQKAVALNPNHAHYHAYLALCQNQTGSADTALASFRRAIDLEHNTTKRPLGYRYQAAQLAILRSTGRVRNAAGLTVAERLHLRRQALGWLQAELTGWTHRAQSGTVADKSLVRRTLHYWQRDPSLVTIRSPQELVHLPASERVACQHLWRDVEALAQRVSR